MNNHPEITFRYATDEDKKQFNRLLLEEPGTKFFLGVHGSEDEVFINSRDHICIVAVVDDKEVGYASVEKAGQDGFNYVENLYVIPKLRKNGVGFALLQFIEKYAFDNWQAVGIMLYTNENDPMEALVKRAGFSLSGTWEKTHHRHNHFFNQSRWYKLYI